MNFLQQVEEGLVSAWLDFLATHSRAAQILHKDHPTLNTLEQGMARYLKEVKKTTIKADKRLEFCCWCNVFCHFL